MKEDIENPFETDRALVEKLWTGNDAAWNYVLCRTVIPMMRQELYYRIKKDRQISEYDVLGMLFDVLVAQKKLATFQFRCPFFLWVRHYVTKVIFSFLQKNPTPVSDENVTDILTGESAREPLDEEIEVARECFRRLWKKNPLRAYVHLLMGMNDMQAGEVMNLLSLSSVQNVYQLHSRAVADMRDLRRELTSETAR